MDGTPRALLPITEAVMVWVAHQRSGRAELRRQTPDELRRIELCALAARDIAMFHDLYGEGSPSAAAPEVQEQRRETGRLQAPEGVGGCGCSCEPGAPCH